MLFSPEQKMFLLEEFRKLKTSFKRKRKKMSFFDVETWLMSLPEGEVCLEKKPWYKRILTWSSQSINET